MDLANFLHMAEAHEARLSEEVLSLHILQFSKPFTGVRVSETLDDSSKGNSFLS